MSEETKYSAAAMRAAEAIQEHRQWKGGAISTVELAQIIEREYQTQIRYYRKCINRCLYQAASENGIRAIPQQMKYSYLSICCQRCNL